MRNATIDAVLRRADARRPTEEERREHEERRRSAARLVGEIAAPPGREVRRRDGRNRRPVD